MQLWSFLQVYLSLPAGVSMTEGQCLICPLQHHTSATGLDEDVWSEMQVSHFRLPIVSIQIKVVTFVHRFSAWSLKSKSYLPTVVPTCSGANVWVPGAWLCVHGNIHEPSQETTHGPRMHPAAQGARWHGTHILQGLFEIWLIIIIIIIMWRF